MLIKLDSHNQAHQIFLYDLQVERYKYKDTNIPHVTPDTEPTLEEHTKRLWLKPFKHYYIYMEDYTYKGAIYIKGEKEICIFIAKQYLGSHCGEKCLTEFLEILPSHTNCKSIIATININNKASIKLFEKMGFKHVGNVYGRTL